MQMPNEITVNRQDFLAAVAQIPRGGLRKRQHRLPRTTLIYADPPLLIVETPYVRTEIAAVGTWKEPVAVNARLLITVTRKLPKTDRLTLLYAGGRLHFGRVSIDATPAPDMPPAKDGRLGPIWEAPQKPLFTTAPADQLLIPGVTPVTDRDRLARLASAPMRPRRR